MNDLIKKEQLSGQKVVVGDKYTDLVLKTLGRVYIQTGSKLVLLNDFVQTLDKATEDVKEESIIIIDKTDEINNLEYPGDGKFVFVKNTQNLYICFNGEFVPIIAKNEAEVNWESLSKSFVNKSGDEMTGDLSVPNLGVEKQITISEVKEAPLIVNSRTLVDNLNANYLEGRSADEFAKKKEDEKISGAWDFVTQTIFSSDTIHGGSLYSKGGFASGFGGYGWMLDSRSNTLTIDNLIVRKTMNVYELVVNKINATNGSLWVTDSAKISELYPMITINYIPEIVNGLEVIKEKYLNHETGLEYNTFEEASAALNSTFESTGLNKSISIKIADLNSQDHVNIDRVLYSHYFTGAVYKLVLDEDNAKYCPFRVNDIIRCQKFNLNQIRYYDAIVTDTDYVLESDPEFGQAKDNTITIRLCKEPTDIKISANGTETEDDIKYNNTRSTSEPKVDDGIVRVGNISDPNRQGAVYITSNDDKSPFIDVSANMNRPDFSVPIPIYKKPGNPDSLRYLTQTKVRLGRIDGLRDPAFGTNQPEGMGLVAENVFLKGRFVQVDGDIEYYIPIYKGEYKDGVIYNPYDYVTYNKVAYLCIKTTDGTINPSNVDYWNVYIEGVKGENGASLMFAGEWDINKEYRIRPDVRTVVTRTVDNGSGGTVTNYYQTMINSEIDLSSVEGLKPVEDGTYIIDPNNPPESLKDLWKTFGGQFSSIATDLILASEAYLAGFRFYKDKLVSGWGTIDDVASQDFTNPNYIPNLELDGINGSIKSRSGLIGGWEIKENYLQSALIKNYQLILSPNDSEFGPSIQIKKTSNSGNGLETIINLSGISSRYYSYFYPTTNPSFEINLPGLLLGYDKSGTFPDPSGQFTNGYSYEVSNFSSIGQGFLNLNHKQRYELVSYETDDAEKFIFPKYASGSDVKILESDLNQSYAKGIIDVINNTYISPGELRIIGHGYDALPVSIASVKNLGILNMQINQVDRIYTQNISRKNATLYLEASNIGEYSSVKSEYKSGVFGLQTDGLYISKNNNKKGYAHNTMRVLAYLKVGTSHPSQFSSYYSADDLNGKAGLITGISTDGKGVITINHSIGHSNYRLIMTCGGGGYASLMYHNHNHFKVRTADDDTANVYDWLDIWIIDMTGLYSVTFSNNTFKIGNFVENEIIPQVVTMEEIQPDFKNSAIN